MYAACVGIEAYSESIHFTSAGDSTAWPGLPRITGSNGSPTSTDGVVTVTITPEAGKVDGGVIGGSVVGGAALGMLFTVGFLFGVYLWRQKRAHAGLEFGRNLVPAGEAVYGPPMVPLQQAPGLMPGLGEAAFINYSRHEMEGAERTELDTSPK